MPFFRFQKSYSPLTICNTRSGTLLPAKIAEQMTEQGLARPDTNWFLIRLLDVSVLERAAVISAELSRYVVDLAWSHANQGGDRAGQRVVPLQTAAGEPIYQNDKVPTEADVACRVEQYYVPFHEQLAAELRRQVEQFGHSLLVDAYSTSDPAAKDIQFRHCDDAGLREWLDRWSESEGCNHSVGFASDPPTSEVIKRHGAIAGVRWLQIDLNEKNYVDSFDGEFDFDDGRELIKTIESLMISLVYWAEHQPKV